MAAEYPGSAYTTNAQSTANDDPGNDTIANGADYNKHDEEIDAIQTDLRAAFAKIAGATDMATAIDRVVPLFMELNTNTGSPALTTSYSVVQMTGDAGVGGAGLGIDSAAETASFTYNANSPPGSPATITRSTGDFTTLFGDGMYITITGTSNNNKTVLVNTVAALTITLDSAETLIDEGPVSSTLDGNAIIISSAAGAGTFAASYHLAHQSPAGAFTITAAIHKNGTEEQTTKGEDTRETSENGVIACSSRFITLAAGDYVDLRHKGSGSQTGTITSAILSLTRVLK